MWDHITSVIKKPLDEFKQEKLKIIGITFLKKVWKFIWIEAQFACKVSFWNCYVKKSLVFNIIYLHKNIVLNCMCKIVIDYILFMLTNRSANNRTCSFFLFNYSFHPILDQSYFLRGKIKFLFLCQKKILLFLTVKFEFNPQISRLKIQ